MRRHLLAFTGAALVTLAALWFAKVYMPVRDATIYGCGVIAGQDSVNDEDRERPGCVEWRLRAASVGFNPFQ